MFGGGLRSLVAAAKAAGANQVPNNNPQSGGIHNTSDESASMADGTLFPLMPQKSGMQRRQQPPSPREASPSGVCQHYYFLMNRSSALTRCFPH